MKCRFVPFVIVGLLLALALPASVVAQDETAPPQTGLRPDAPTYALHGPYWVGTRNFVIEPDSQRPLPVTVWYPALNPDAAEEKISYDLGLGEGLPALTVEGHALLDAQADPAAAPYPLVVFSHANASTRFSYAYLTEHVASYGFVVVALNHTGTSFGDYMALQAEDYQKNDIAGMINRPLDIQRAIDLMVTLTAQGGALAGLIDTEHVAQLGHSYGGYATLAAGGARLNLDAFKDWCAKTTTWGPNEHQMCYLVGHDEELAALAGLDAVPEGIWPELNDPRIDALVGYSPGRIPSFGTDGLAALKLPALFFVGSQDSDSPPERYLYPMYEAIGSAEKALVVLQGADHYVFADSCAATPWLVEWGLSFACSDPVWDSNRAHDLIDHLTTAFLLDVLKGDKEAAAALAPDAVSFNGITYQAEGF